MGVASHQKVNTESTFVLHDDRETSKTKMTAPDLEELYSFAISLARSAGAKILASSTSRSSSSGSSSQTSADATKKNRVDLVTETDQLVEKFVREEIGKKYPDHAFIGEGSFAAGEKVELTVRLHCFEWGLA